MAQRRNLLLCLDAFGTLFRPKRPIERQYAEVAAKYGLTEFEQEETVRELKTTFRRAFKEESQKHPNYGKGAGLDAAKWWSNIIHNSLQPLVSSKKTLPSEVVPELIQRFHSHEGYQLFDDVKPLFSMLQDTKAHLLTQPAPPPTSNLSVQWPWERTIVGVITNSDNAIPDVLSSFGFRVGARRVGKRKGGIAKADLEEDISFVVMSYDAGYEKPNHHIYDAAIWMLEECLAAEAMSGRDLRSTEFEKLMVGDDPEKDFNGPREAGWEALLLDRDGAMSDAKQTEAIASAQGSDGETLQVIDDLTKIRFWRPEAEDSA